MRTCVVTGGAGFIGSWLCQSLLEEGHRVICVDNLVTGRKENISQLLEREGFIFKETDVTKGLGIKDDIDFLFHLASPASPIDYQKLPIETMMSNSIGTLNSLELARKRKARILLASTSEVYGDPKEHPQKESDWGNVNPIGPRSCYDESKRFAEALGMSFKNIHDLDVRIIRIFNTYGPRMRENDGRAIPNFIYQALKQSPITVYGDGKQTRSFCYVTDMIDGLKKFMFSEDMSGEVLNMGNPDEHKILNIAEIIKSLTDSGSEIVFQELPEDDPARRKPDISKAREKLGWKPEIELYDGLKKTIEWFNK